MLEALKLADELIASTHLNVLGEAFLGGDADAIEPEDLPSFSANRQLAVEMFVRRRPELATYQHIWRGRPNSQREMFQALL